MKKRILALAGMAATMIFGMSLTSFAAEEPKWIVPKGLSAGEYQSMYGTSDWYVCEGVAQCQAWAEANKGDIIGIHLSTFPCARKIACKRLIKAL